LKHFAIINLYTKKKRTVRVNTDRATNTRKCMKWKGMKPEARDYLPAGKEKDRGVSNTFHKVYFPAVQTNSVKKTCNDSAIVRQYSLI